MSQLARGLGVFVLAVLVTGVADVAGAQASPSAATVLSNVQQFYANANQLTVSFRQTATNATFNMPKTSDGELWVLKPTEFRWDYFGQRNGQSVIAKTFIFDGTTLWLVDHQNKQIIQNKVQSSVLPAAVSFLTGGGALSSQFGAALDTSGTYGGPGAIVLALTPNQPSAQYKRLFFVVDPSDWRVKESIVVDAGGDTNDFRFYAPNVTSQVNASWFQVNPASLPTYKLVPINPTGPTPAPARSP